MRTHKYHLSPNPEPYPLGGLVKIRAYAPVKAHEPFYGSLNTFDMGKREWLRGVM